MIVEWINELNQFSQIHAHETFVRIVIVQCVEIVYRQIGNGFDKTHEKIVFLIVSGDIPLAENISIWRYKFDCSERSLTSNLFM